MAPFVIRRLIGMVAVLFGVSVLVYVVFILVPGGDPAERMAGKNPLPANILNIRKKWGFDQPFYVQYVKMMQKAGNGLIGKHGEYDILTSFQNRQNVVHEIKRGIPATFSLCIGAGIIWLLFGILVGFFSAVTAGRWSDRLITTFALIGVSMPVAWLAVVLRYFLAEQPKKPIFPDGEYVPLTADPVQWAFHLLLPWFCLSVLFIGFYGRVLRPKDQTDVLAERLLEVKGLKVSFATEDGVVRAVDGVDFELDRGSVFGIVGESGSGKSVTAMTILGLTRDKNTRFEGEVVYKGQNLLAMPESRLRDVRGNEIAMIFQDPMTSLNPVYKVGDQIIEAIVTHEDISKRMARQRAVELLRQVGIPNPQQRVDDYPHQFSGGMRQRAMIAMALSCNPDILIADEPTTALDVTIQAQILELIDQLKDDFNSAVILITHDLGVVADVANEILVMYAGRVVERGPKRSIFYDPQHPYTWGLLGSIPRLDRPKGGRLASIKGMPPSLINLPKGCKFRPRCPHAFDRCVEEPDLRNRVEERRQLDRCWLSIDEKRDLRKATIKGQEAVA